MCQGKPMFANQYHSTVAGKQTARRLNECGTVESKVEANSGGAWSIKFSSRRRAVFCKN